MLSIVNNISSLRAQKSLVSTSSGLSRSLERLSTGLKLNRGADGPAALVISQQQRDQIAELTAAIESTNQTVAMVQTSESALNEVNTLLTQVRGLALDSANTAVTNPEAAAANQAEIDQAVASINQIARSTTFGGRRLFDGSVTISAGSGGTPFTLPAVNSATLGADPSAPGDSSLASLATGGANSLATDPGNAKQALEIVDRASAQVASLRASLGTFQANSLEAHAENLRTSLDSTLAAESAIRDTDFAAEIASLTQLQVIQSGTSVLAEANQTPQLILPLLRG